MRFSVADVFAGCGGLSHGFSRTGLYQTLLGTDIDMDALTTFAHNHGRRGHVPDLVAGDVRQVKAGDLNQRLVDGGLGSRSRLDVLMGGPPCEGFSQNRRQEVVNEDGSRTFTRNPLDSRDPRNELVRYFLTMVGVSKPRAVLIENVPQLATTRSGAFVKEIVAHLERLSYRASWRVLNAADFGVPQTRKRVFIVGVTTGLPEFIWPTPTHSKDGQRGLLPYVTVADAISDLPGATSRELGRRNVRFYREAVSSYSHRMRSVNETPMNHVVRVPGPLILERLAFMRPGMRATDLPERLRPKSHYYNCYGRMAWNEPARTITKSCNYLGSGCFGHPEEMRGITMREAARLQGFDDDFDFLSRSEPHTAKMIGGAVPPVLAEVLGDALAKSLDHS